MPLSFGEKEDLGSILLRVIRTLNDTDTGEERDAEKAKLQGKFKEVDLKVEQMVYKHQRDLTQVMQTYARISSRLVAAKTRVKSVREGLQSCKSLLHYKRDELKKLWLDGVEHRQILLLLSKIEELKDSPEKISRLLSQKNYLEATKALVLALNNLNGELQNVDGLIEVREVLEAKKEGLYRTLMEDLTKQLYIESTWELLESKRYDNSFKDNPFRRSSSYRGSSGKPGQRSGSGRKETRSASTPHRDDRNANRRPTEIAPRSRRALLETATSNSNQMSQMRMLTLSQEEEFQRALDNPKLADLDGGPPFKIIVNIECLTMLNKQSEAAESLRGELDQELENIITRTTQTLIDAGPFPQGDPKLFPELFSAVVEQFYMVVDSFRLLSMAIPKAADRHQCSFVRIDLNDVWSRVQEVIRQLLRDYLDFKNKNNIHQQSTSSQYSEPASDINSFFVRRKTQRPKRESLFRFDYSSTALSMNEYLKEQNVEDVQNPNFKKASKTLVCSPDPHNITPIYSSLMELINVIEKALRCDVGNHCALYDFLKYYIKDDFLAQISVDNGDALNAATISLDSLVVIADIDVLREHHAQLPLLQSTVGIKKSVDNLHRYMKTLPLYCEHFLTNICNVVMKYKEICLNSYNVIVQVDNEDRSKVLAIWMRDDEFVKTMRTLPNWLAAHSKDSISESLQDVDQRNKNEISMLIQKVGDMELKQLLDSTSLKSLALLQESLAWFSKNILALGEEFKVSNATTVGELPKLSDNSVQTLTSLATEFGELADACLLGIHLEVRIHCFHFLYPISKGAAGAMFQGGQDSTDPNPEVIKLTKDLLKIDDALKSCLHPLKVRYIFEGVPHLLALILINSANNIRKINTNGVKKMCRNLFALQQTLTSTLTGSREVALDNAKQYYELCNQKPTDILNGIVEKGPMFSKAEYESVLRLLNRSDPNTNTRTLNANLEKLAEIIQKVGVAV